MLAVRNFDDPDQPKRFEFGFIGSSDIHTAKPGTGYKEFWRGEMTEGRGFDSDRSPPEFMIPDHGEPVSRSVPLDLSKADVRGMSFFENERVNSFFVTGGLVAVHAAGRDRGAIWDALQRKEVYGTSGPRILLFFDLLARDGSKRPMGSKLRLQQNPRFRVSAVGSFVQKPGCPPDSLSALGEDRLADLCGGECYHPSDERRRIERIEVVRIRPQSHAGEDVAGLVEDPWRSFDCPANPAGCSVEFDDPDFAAAARDAVYYVRAIEAPSMAIHGSNPLGCEYDEAGRCISVQPCGVRVPKSEDCLSETRPRAWSSPIFVDFADIQSGGR
ncbi:MAG: DUF3604 domain-containing protein [Deltaproteobacteria bacterium]|nr:DUF3604 domain-containing protein [Deltaproteobacteria bacterium]